MALSDRIPIQTTPAGLNPSPNGPSASGSLGANVNTYQLGADAVTGKNTNTFNVWRYPSEIGSPEVPHYAMFYATVRKSSLSSLEATANAPSPNVDASANNPVQTEPKAISGYVSAAGAMAGSTIAGSVLGSPFKVIGFAAGAAVAQSAPIQNSIQSDTKVLIKDVVALYLSGKPSVQYAASWADVDVGVAAQLGTKAQDTIDNLKSIGGDITKIFSPGGWDNLKAQTTKGIQDLLSGTTGLAASLILKNADKGGVLGNFGAALQASAAVVPNPFKAQLFHTMGFRTFTFDYTFLPKDAHEYAQVQKIIKIFKMYMHPTLEGDKYIMSYPAEWNIAYYYKGATNPELFKIANCALTNCKVEYGGTDFTTFKRIPGGPTEISMQLAFVELELLTKARIMAGY